MKMIIRRLIYPQNESTMNNSYDNGMEVKQIYSKANSTSAGVDDLLKPISRQKNNDEPYELSKERTERNLWRNDEVMEMLYTMQKVKALEKLNDKTVKSENVFKDVEVLMHRNGFVKKSHVQIWTKWKFLKSTYMTSRRNGIMPRIVAPQIYKMIHQMITGLNQSLTDSCSSVDGDNSSPSGMIISGVEGGLSNVNTTNEEDDDDSFSMAHPIFGFRLGMVKAEPEDTGYEPVDNNGSDKDPLEEELSHSKSNKEVKAEHNNSETKTSKEPQQVQKIIEIPHRGRGRPPKNPPSAMLAANSTSSTAATKPAQMPPLRVAPFAKTIQTTNSVAASRPPPPLTMPPTSRIRVTNLSNLKNEDPGKFAQPKLIPRPIQQQQSPPEQAVRVFKEISQTRSSSSPSPSYPKMKQIPMRKTPYSLRPDRAIPDLEASLSPPPPAVEKPSSKKMEEVTTTKHHQIMQTSSNNFQNMSNRKRRFDWQEPVPNKQPKYNNGVDEERNNSKLGNIDCDKNYGKVLQNVIIDLSSSLRKMQTGMMRDFFNKQNELLEREHRFQTQQDHMIMKAFQEQTHEIMHSVRYLVSSIRSQNKCQHNHTEENIKKVKPTRNTRMQQMHAQEIEEDEIGVNQMENNGNYNEIEVEEQGQDQEEVDEQDTEDVYSDGEEQQDQMTSHDEHDQEDEMENNDRTRK